MHRVVVVNADDDERAGSDSVGGGVGEFRAMTVTGSRWHHDSGKCSRYYGAQGLLEPSRGSNGYRKNPGNAVVIVAQIQKMLEARVSGH